MNRLIFLLLLSLLVQQGCVTDELSVKTSVDPNAVHSIDSSIYIDSQTDLIIEDRKYFLEVPEMLGELGVNTAGTPETADYVMFFKFKEGLKYRPGRRQFEFNARNQKVFYGIIDAGLFRLTEDKRDFVAKAEWSGFVEVGDIRDRLQLKRSLQVLIENLTKEVNTNVPRVGGVWDGSVGQ